MRRTSTAATVSCPRNFFSSWERVLKNSESLPAVWLLSDSSDDSVSRYNFLHRPRSQCPFAREKSLFSNGLRLVTVFFSTIKCLLTIVSFSLSSPRRERRVALFEIRRRRTSRRRCPSLEDRERVNQKPLGSRQRRGFKCLCYRVERKSHPDPPFTTLGGDGVLCIHRRRSRCLLLAERTTPVERNWPGGNSSAPLPRTQRAYRKFIRSVGRKRAVRS